MSAEFDRIYAESARRSIPPEQVLKASLLIVLVRSDRLTDRNLLLKVRRQELKIPTNNRRLTRFYGPRVCWERAEAASEPYFGRTISDNWMLCN